MTVTFGTPSAEQVTMIAGTPLSNTGRISSGSRVVVIVIAISRFWRRNSGARARSGRLEKHFLDLDLDGNAGARDGCTEQIRDVTVRVQRLKTLHESLACALGEVVIGWLDRVVAEVASLELVRLEGADLFERERHLAVVEHGLDELAGGSLGDERRERASILVDPPAADAVSGRDEMP